MPTDCVFCGISEKSIPAEIIRETDELIVIPDINPKAPIHILIIPKRHIPSLASLNEADAGLLGRLLDAARQIASDERIADTGYKVVINTGPDGGQVVPHLHLHVLGGKKLTDTV